MRRLAAVLSCALLLAALPPGPACAQDAAGGYPSKTVRIVVPYPPGGSTDALARVVASKLQERFGQSVIVDNRPGAGSNLGAQYVAAQPADGYTLLLGTSAALAVNRSLFKNLPYDALTSFAPVVLGVTLPSLVVVHPSVPVHSIAELNAWLKTNAGKVSYASAGNGTPAHLGMEMYKKTTGLNINHVPYRGGAPALIDMVGGQVQVMFAILPEALPFVRDGKLRAIAVTTAERAAQTPELPTVAEAGVPGYELTAWYAFVAPAGTPAPIVGKLNKEINAILAEPQTREQLTNAGFTVGGGTPERLAELMRSEAEKWAQVVKDANVKVD